MIEEAATLHLKESTAFFYAKLEVIHAIQNRRCGPMWLRLQLQCYLRVSQETRVLQVPVLEASNVGLDHTGTRLSSGHGLCETARLISSDLGCSHLATRKLPKSAVLRVICDLLKGVIRTQRRRRRVLT